METEEETQTPSKPSVPTERRTRSKGAEVENETKTIKSQTSPRPNMTLSFKESAIQAIQEVNGSTEELKGNARICGAHFISGQASMDHDSLDFVPSVFTCRKPSQGPQKEVKRGRGRPRRKARVQTEEKPTPSRVDSPVDLHSSVLMETEEETQTPSKPSVPTERRTRSKGAEVENETKTIKSQTSPRPNMTLSFKESAIQAIQEVNGSTEELKGNARICGAHFISGQASMDHDSLDFVPSVFTCRKPSQGPQKEVKRGRGRPRRKARVQTEEKSTPSRVDSPVDLHSSVLMETEEEETQTPSKPSVPTERRTRSKGAEVETEAKTIKSQTSPRPNKTSPSFKASAGFLKQHKISPIVLLKSVIAATGGYQCELCNQNFSSMSLLVKHKQLHEEQKSFICEICGKYFTSEADFTEHQRSHKDKPFPCNICDRSFSTNHNLKRHKLLHVKDGRKCRLCGVLSTT
uniref:C2H2-type domain-containing protein n=2 Tax=Monopterus albus TaxID=43700 RepID=A0A3Q3QVW3_MONAL|nr:histone-lysine N-methyltransferase PRDM9-like [Monopterus albus]